MQLPGILLPGGDRDQITIPWTVRSVLIASGLVVAVFVGTVILVSIAVSLAGESRDWLDDGQLLGFPASLALAAVLEAFFLGAVLLVVNVKDWAGVRQLGFIPATGRAPYALALGAWFVGLVASGLWILLSETTGIDALQPPDSASEVLDYSGGKLVLPIIVVGLFGPFCEEVFFRGFALPAFVKRYGMWGGIALSAALFSVFHFSIGLLVPVFIFGIVLGWLYARTGSIYPSMVAHAVQNVVALLLVN
ncbi:MAG: type II CAAX endopeptidase family protein [Chloroflexi bacterium]|nr:type II CAAX endopeptidase family protein [Chloroflexota bacterium]